MGWVQTPLHEAAVAAGSTFPLIRKHAIEIAKILLAANADVNIKNIVSRSRFVPFVDFAC